MTREIRFARRAVRQIAAAAAWWHENRPGAALLFEQELGQALRTIEQSPALFVELSSVSVPGVRRVLMARTRYHLYWRVRDEQKIIEILACWHTSRGRVPPSLG